MASKDLDVFTEDEPRFGENVARHIRIVARLLQVWKGGKENREFLKAIYFDKLVEFHCRIWDGLHVAGHVRFAAPFGSHRGFHGPGRALKIDRSADSSASLSEEFLDRRRHQWAYSTEIVEKLKPSLGNARRLFRLEGRPEEESCKVYPGIDASQWESWLMDEAVDGGQTRFLEAREVDLVNRLAELIRGFSKDEVRAIGTHANAKATVGDIRFNLSHWNRAYDELMRIIREDGGRDVVPNLHADLARFARVLVFTAREVENKGRDNREDYRSARERAVKVPDNELAAVIERIQSGDGSIWDDAVVCKFGQSASLITAFSVYIRRAIRSIYRLERLSAKEMEESDSAFEALASVVAAASAGALLPFDSVKGAKLDVFLREVELLRKAVFAQVPSIRDRSGTGVP